MTKARQGLLGDKSSNRQEIAGVLYDTNVLGFKGPRRMTGRNSNIRVLKLQGIPLTSHNSLIGNIYL